MHRPNLCPLIIVLIGAFAPGGAHAEPPDNAAGDARLARIQQLIQSGDLRDARIEVHDALKALGQDSRLYNFLGVIEAQEQNFGGAEASFRRAIEMAPGFTGAYLNLGRLYQEHSREHAGMVEKALDVYRKLLQVEPDNVEANYQVAWLLNRMNKFQPSLDHLARLPSGAQTRAPALALRCANYAALDKAAQATAFGKQLMAAPDLTEADVLPIIPALTQHHQADLASTLLEGLFQRGFGSSATLNQLATVYEEGGRFREAREILEKELQTSGQPSAALLNRLAKVAYRAGDLEGALGYLAHARDLEPGNALIHFLFGLVCVDLKLPPEAKQSLKEAVRLDPKNAYYNYALGAVLLQERNPEESIPYFEVFRKAQPDDPRGRFALGVAYFDAYKLDAARKEFESVANRPETRMGAHLYLGRLAFREDRLDEAADHLEQSIQANPSGPEPYAELGLVQIRLEKYELAQQTLSRAIQLAPDNYRANLNLLLLYKRTKDPRAEQQARRVEQLQAAGEERERTLLRSLEIRPY